MNYSYLSCLIYSDIAGAWNFSVSPKGYINQDLYVEVLKDLDQHLTKNNIQRPVLLIIDGAKPHISLQAAQFCLANQIQPVLLKPNFTHLLQVKITKYQQMNYLNDIFSPLISHFSVP